MTFEGEQSTRGTPTIKAINVISDGLDFSERVQTVQGKQFAKQNSAVKESVSVNNFHLAFFSKV